MSLADFLRIGIYGFRSKEAVTAYLKAWAISGLDTPTFGQKTELPSKEFPDFAELYGRIEPADDAPALEDSDDADDDDDTEDEDEAQDAPSPRPQPSPKPRPEVNAIDGFLAVLDKMDPADVVKGQSAESVTLLIKTMESWLESLREAAETE
jgi:hypothetical protein